MSSIQLATRTSVPQRAQQPQEEPIKIIRNNEWAWIYPSELTPDERRVIFVAAFQIYE